MIILKKKGQNFWKKLIFITLKKNSFARNFSDKKILFLKKKVFERF